MDAFQSLTAEQRINTVFPTRQSEYPVKPIDILGKRSFAPTCGIQEYRMSKSNPIDAFTVPAVLENLQKGEWLVPAFQREFIWDVSAIISLGTSIIDGYPIGMMTLWDKSEEDDFSDLERVSLPDWDADKSEVVKKPHGERDSKFPKAILDGRQRCTALSMLFAGFAQLDGKRKYSGKFFLDVTAQEPNERITFIKTTELKKKGLTSDTSCMASGLFPLSPSEDKQITDQWLDYVENIRKPEIYPDSTPPSEEELDRRVRILRSAYKGIFNSTVAVYTVPNDYDLGKICDIFETLNQTGVKVSTVDLIHSWILTETTMEGDPIAIRDWMEDASALEGAIGWVSAEKRPELTAQFVTACYVARDKKPEPPRKTKGVRKDITSVKSPDLLNTPKSHWRQIISRQNDFADFLGDFQRLVAGGAFGAEKCPYPVSAAIYVALRWHLKSDFEEGEAPWSRTDLDALYRAFFWWNALSGRYDQGFLTQLGTDIRFFKDVLQTRIDYPSAAAWIAETSPKLELHMDKDLPSPERLALELKNGRPGGAKQSAFQLQMIARPAHDIGGKELKKGSPLQVELHHIFPKKWCSNNATDEYEHLFNSKKSEIDFVNSIANQMPLSPVTNKEWKDMSPGAYVAKYGLRFESVSETLEKVGIDEPLFDLMTLDAKGAEAFWNKRAEKMASVLLKNTKVSL